MKKLELGFAGTPLREQLVAAVLSGAKTAMAGLLSDYEHENGPVPCAGERMVLIANDDEALAIVEITGARNRSGGGL